MEESALIWAAFCGAAYLIGGIPFGFLIGKMRGVDIRTVGSKNIGATNVFRSVGKKWGFIAFACDVLKGLIPVLIARHFAGSDAAWTHLALVTGLACVIGHMLTPYMRFKGGKGVATGFGMLIGLVPALVGVAFALFIVVFALSHYISLGSCSAAAFLAIMIWLPYLGSSGTANIPQAVLVTFISLFVIFKHRANIGRLIKGTENKIYIFKS